MKIGRLRDKISLPEMLAGIAVTNAQSSNSQKELEALIMLYNKIQEASSQLLTISDYNIVGSAYCLMGSYPLFMNNENARRVIADNAFYCLSRAIEKEQNKAIYIKRLSVLAYFHKDFYYTIANAMGISDSESFFQRVPLIVKTNQYYYDIAYHDFLKVGQNNYPEKIGELYELVRRTNKCSAQKGKVCIDKIISYLTSVYQQY